MNWLAWRQHRKQFMIGAIFLVLFAAITIPTGLHFWHIYQQAHSTCAKTNTCNQLNGELFQSNIDSITIHLVQMAVLFLPILLGLFWGVPFLAREYSEGTNKLVWTQSISRRKWLTTKLIWLLLGAIVIAAGFTALETWWFRPENALNLNQFETPAFSTQGIVPVAYSFFAVTLGVMFGAWFKRTMVALGVTLFLLIAIMMILVPNGLRPHYEAPLNYKVSLLSGVGVKAPPTFSRGALSGATLVLNQNPVNAKGQALNWANPPQQCIVTPPSSGNGLGTVGPTKRVITNTNTPIMGQNGGPPVSFDCLNSLGYTMNIEYQPAYRYWDFQRIETGLYLALSAIPIGITYWLVLRRDA